MNIKSPEHYLRRLNQIPQNAKQILQDIKKLDRLIAKLQIEISEKRQNTLKNIMAYEEKKGSKTKLEIEDELKKINQIYKRMIKSTRKKKELAEALYNLVDQPTEQLEKDLSNYIQIQPDNGRKGQKGRRGKKDIGEQYFTAQPCYCYCKTPSFGLMVKCQNEKCQTQWFHTHCIEDNQEIQGKWYCRDCRKSRQNRRAS